MKRTLEISRKYEFTVHPVGSTPEGGVISPGNMMTGNAEELITRFEQRRAPLLHRELSEMGACRVPYTFPELGRLHLGQIWNPGELLGSGMRLILEQDRAFPPLDDFGEHLYRYAALKNPKQFQLDSELTRLCGMSLTSFGDEMCLPHRLSMTLGRGRYSQSFYSNGSQGLRIEDPTDAELERLSVTQQEELRATVVRLRQLMLASPNACLWEVVDEYWKGLPSFEAAVHANTLGVACMVLTSDDEFVFVLRGKNVSVNHGVNCTAGGAVEWCEHLHILRSNGVLWLLSQAMRHEIETELGLPEEEYDLHFLNLIRELPRGGKPEAMFLVETCNSAKDLVECIQKNQHPEKKEVEGLLSIPKDKVWEMLRTGDALQIIQHKGVANLMLAYESAHAPFRIG